MADNTVGSVTYSVDVDYSELTGLESAVEKTTNSVEQDFKQADKTIKQASEGISTSMTKTAVAVKTAGQNMTKAGTEIDKTGNSMRGVSGVAGQLGFQLQDIAVQAQMGASAFTILGQQGSQIASAFGPGGAVFGAVLAVGAAIGGIAFSAQESSVASERLEKSMEALSRTAEQTDDGVTILTSEIEKLASVSKQAATAQIIIGLNDAKKAALEAGKAIAETFSADYGFTGLQDLIASVSSGGRAGSFEGFNEVIRETGEQLGFTGEKATEVGRKIFDMLVIAQKTGSPQALQNLQDYMAKLIIDSEGANVKLTSFAGTLTEFFSKARTAGEAIAFLESAQKDLTAALETGTASGQKNLTSLQELIKAAEAQAAVIGLTERGIALYTAEQIGATKADRDRINAIYDVIEAKKTQIQADKEWQKEAAELQDEIIANERQSQQDEANMRKKRQDDYGRITAGIAKDIESPAQRARRELDERLNVIKEFNNLESMEQARKTEAGIAAEQAYQLRLTEITKAEEGQRLQTQQNLLNQSLALTENVFGNIADAIERSKGRESAAFKAAFLAQKAAAIAMAVLQIELAAATAIAPPPFGLGPVAGLPYSQFIRGIGYTSVAIMAGQSLAGMGGGKLYGGPVSGGMMYPFMENGKPEALQMGGKTYLWTGGGNGTVIPNGDLTGGGQGVNISVVVENYGSDNVDVQRQTKGSGVTAQEVIKIVVGNISQRGEIHGAITRNTTAGNRSS